jgi:hypothetical protein
VSVDPRDEHLLRRAYEAFNARDIEAAIVLMRPDVEHVYTIRDGLVERMDVR